MAQNGQEFDLARMIGALIVQLFFFFVSYWAMVRNVERFTLRTLIVPLLVAFVVAALGMSGAGNANQVHVVAYGITFSLGLLIYFRRAKAAPSGWRRIGAVMTVLALAGIALSVKDADARDAAGFARFIVFIWIVALAVSWVISGFRAKT